MRCWRPGRRNVGVQVQVLQIFGQWGRGNAVNANTSALAASMSVPILGLTNRESNHSEKHPSELSQDGPLLGGRVAPGHWLSRAGDRIALCAHARRGCCADVMASRRVGYRPHRLAVRMWTVSGVVPWASGVTNVSIQIVPHRVTGRVVAARSG
jgi:hypothetical protein